jgi:DNA repair protein RadC
MEGIPDGPAAGTNRVQMAPVPNFARCETKMKITSPSEAFAYFRTRLGLEVEEFWIATMNADKRVTSSQCLFRGTVDHCLFHPRDVFRFACLHNASSFVVAHNHPSGRVAPSELDLRITEQLLTVSLLLELPLIDHLILGGRQPGSRYFSFLESGLLKVEARDLASPSGR